MKPLLFVLLLAAYSTLFAQKKTNQTTAVPGMPSQAELMKMSRMSPAELEAYQKKLVAQLEKQASALADSAGLQLDESLFESNTLQAPRKDVKRLASLPREPLSLPQLLKRAQEIELALARLMTPAQLAQASRSLAGRSASEMSYAAISYWLSQNPLMALWSAVKTAEAQPDHLPAWNNLAALFNMTAMQQQAIAVLQYCLVKKPGNSTLLNNMGQAYLGLGDIPTASEYLRECLAADDLHPEANRSMAMISLMEGNSTEAQLYFEKEMQISMRRSSLAGIRKNGLREKLNLAHLRQQRMQRQGVDKRNYFEEIALTRFAIPDLPVKTADADAFRKNNAGYFKSIEAEYRFWFMAAAEQEDPQAGAQRNIGMYADLVDELLADLDATYLPLLPLLRKEDLSQLENMHTSYVQKMANAPCPPIVTRPGDGPEVIMAHEKKCCNIKAPLIDEYMFDYNGFLTERIAIAQARWKEYINAMVSMVQLDPTTANKKRVYAAVARYFSFLIQATQAVAIEMPPAECHVPLTTEQADAILQARHDVDIQCPDWLKLKLSIKFVKLSLDCDAFTAEADAYSLLTFGMEKKFKTGTSTLYIGAGIDGSFGNYANGGITQQVYIVFDHNNQFSDIGLKGGATGDLANGMLSGEFGYDFSMNSGFNAQATTQSPWMEKASAALDKIK